MITMETGKLVEWDVQTRGDEPRLGRDFSRVEEERDHVTTGAPSTPRSWPKFMSLIFGDSAAHTYSYLLSCVQVPHMNHWRLSSSERMKN